MTDILPELRSLLAGQPTGSGARDVLERGIAELEQTRRSLAHAQDRGTAHLNEARRLNASLLGRPIVPCMRAGALDLELPRYETEGAVGADLRADLSRLGELPLGVAWVEEGRRIRLSHGARIAIPSGFAFAIPEGYEGEVRHRSSGAIRGVVVEPAVELDGAMVRVGTIDRDYRGAVGTCLWYLGDWGFEVTHGDRISQFVISPVARAEMPLVDELPSTGRGAGGYGSTGVR